MSEILVIVEELANETKMIITETGLFIRLREELQRQSFKITFILQNTVFKGRLKQRTNVNQLLLIRYFLC